MKKKKDDLIIDKDHRAYKDLALFLIYLTEHPKERLFQALRNWIGCGYLMADGQDTFYWEFFKENKIPKQRKKCSGSFTIQTC